MLLRLVTYLSRLQRYGEKSSPQNIKAKNRHLLTIINNSRMFETINQRIKAVLDTVYHGNVTAMAKGSYIKRTTINSIVGPNETTPGFDVIAKIGEISSPRISMEWLVRGVGDMFLDEKDTIIYNNGVNGDNNASYNDSDMLSRLVGLVEAKDKQLAEKDKQINTLLEIIKAK